MKHTLTINEYFVFPDGTRVLRGDLERDNPALYNDIMIQAAQIGFNKIAERYDYGVKAIRKTQ